MSYYSIYIPTKSETEINDKNLVFTEIEEALKVLKNYKDGRLKSFKNIEDAENYAQTGYENYQTKQTDLKSPSATVSSTFRAPTKQELIQFRKAIENDNFVFVKNVIEENPRYLINYGDTPTSLKEGPRYNALHVCAIHNRSKIAAFILGVINSDKFIEDIHGQKNSKVYREVSEILLDYYLNMPEKGRNETPLHLAAKYGSADIVEVLTSYPQCKMTPNSENLLPKDIVCSRMNEPSLELKNRITLLLDDRFYVPVIRSVDNSVPPLIGEPYSQINPPEFSKDPKSPELEIQAFAGPMTKEQAETFRRRWKTPPRVRSPGGISLGNSPYITPVKTRHTAQHISTSISSPSNNNNNNNTPLTIFPKKRLFSNNPFIDSNNEDHENANGFTNEKAATTTTGTDVPDNNNETRNELKLSLFTPLRKNPHKRDLFFTYREKGISPVVIDNCFNYSPNKCEMQNVCDSPGWKERHLKLSDTEKGLELIGRELAKENKVEWKEYWDFLECFVDISSAEGLTKLEMHLKGRKQMDLLCNAMEHIGVSAYERQLMEKKKDTMNPQQQKSYLCVEKSMQVFAKRMTKTILHNIESVLSINDALNSELKRLKSLICSFKDDDRFLTVDFNVVHSRFAKLIADYLKNSCDMTAEKLMKTKNNFLIIIRAKSKSTQGKTATANEKEQLTCVSEFIIKYLNQSDNKIVLEDLKTEEICEETWKNETSCNCAWNSTWSVMRQNSRKSKRFEFANASRKIFDTNQCGDANNLENEEKDKSDGLDYCNSLDSGDKKVDADQKSSEIFTDVVDSSDEEIFWSDCNSEEEENDDDDEIYYTPPNSPLPDFRILENNAINDYNLYLMANEPTKRDLDVFNALVKVNIDPTTYPLVNAWKSAMMRYSIEERLNFPSPSVVHKTRPKEDKLYENSIHKISFSSRPMQFTASSLLRRDKD